RRGKKRAIVAVGHTMLIAIWHMLKNECDYKDLGPHHFDRLNPEMQMRYHVKRLKSLGYTVDVQRVA
ncbi:MAG: IS110 family transposase, partial [Planctomycetes bacterium]|nr:IS110 family transposase [Planctomycetota bacterium]